MKVKLIFATLLLLMFSSFATFSQTKVTGIVSDAQGEPLMGVSVVVGETNMGTVTNLSGEFQIQVSNEKSKLVFSYLGFKRKEIVVGANRQITVVMEEELRDLDEVVVIGYGVQKKSHLTGSISRLRNENLEDLPVARADQLLMGRIAGVAVQNIDPEAGGAPQIRIRGTGSLSASNDPLVVIDGFPIQEGLESLNVADIESIEILKDAASAAIYGSRAANGVVLVTTKSAKEDKAKYTVKAFGGSKSVYKLHPMMNTGEYMDLLTSEALKEPSLRPVSNRDYARYYLYQNAPRTDWQKEGLNDFSKMYNVQANVSGGKKDLKYYVSAGFISDEGIMVHSDYQRLNLRTKLNANLSKSVELAMNTSFSYSDREKPSTKYSDFFRSFDWLPVKHNAITSALTGIPEGQFAAGRDFNNRTYYKPNTANPDGPPSAFTASPWTTANNNPMSIMENEELFQQDYSANVSTSLNFKITKDLQFKTSNGFNYKDRENDSYRNYESRKDGEPNQATYRNQSTIDLLTENTLNYNKKIQRRHDISVMLGQSYQYTVKKTADIMGVNFPTDLVHTLNGASIIQGSNTATIKSSSDLLSFLGRANYSYQDKYLLSTSFRADKSSLFGSENQWGYFPSVSIGWRLSEESFMKEINWIDMLKVRGSFGVTGNNDIAEYAYLNLLNTVNYSLGSGNGNIIPGLANTTGIIGNEAISWEQTNEFNLGVDWSILGSRINLSAEYYYSRTQALLFMRPVLNITGNTRYWDNVGKVRNSGVEIELSTFNIKNKKFSWETSLNFSLNKNRLLELANDVELMINYGDMNEMYLAKVGDPAIQYYGYEVVGIWKSQAEIDNNPHHNLDQPGGLRVKNQNGDDVIDDEDRVPLGSPYPDFTWGINNTIKWNGFDFFFLFQGVQGSKIMNGDSQYTDMRERNRLFVTSNRWISENNPGDGKTPYITNGLAWEYTDYIIEDGSYVALRNVVLGYTIPKKMLKKARISSLRFFATADNLLYLMSGNYRGINPEAKSTSGNYGSALMDGYQRGSFPLQRTFTLGFDLTF